MKPLPDCTKLTHFPYPESSWLEFKQTFISCSSEKINETICGFLNSGGGYIIIGIHDATLEIIGLTTGFNEYDGFALRIDEIYHNRKIIQSDGKSISPNSIRVTYLPTAKPDRMLSVVIVTPPPGDATYMMRETNVAIYRVNASNYRIEMDKKGYTQEEVDNMIERERQSAHDSIQAIMRNKLIKHEKVQKDLIKQLNMIQSKNEECVSEVSALKDRVTTIEKLLFDKILAEKAAVEKELATSVWRSLLCL